MSFPDDPVGCVVCNQPVSSWACTKGLILCGLCYMNYGGPLAKRPIRKTLIFAESYGGAPEVITYRSFSCTPGEAQLHTKMCLDEFKPIFDAATDPMKKWDECARAGGVVLDNLPLEGFRKAEVAAILQFTKHRHPCRHCGYELGCGITTISHSSEPCPGSPDARCPQCGCPLKEPA